MSSTAGVKKSLGEDDAVDGDTVGVESLHLRTAASSGRGAEELEPGRPNRGDRLTATQADLTDLGDQQQRSRFARRHGLVRLDEPLPRDLHRARVAPADQTECTAHVLLVGPRVEHHLADRLAEVVHLRLDRGGVLCPVVEDRREPPVGSLVDLGLCPRVGRDAGHVPVGDVVAHAGHVRDDVAHAPCGSARRDLLELGVGAIGEELRHALAQVAVRGLVVAHEASVPADAMPIGQLTPVPP